MSEQWYNRYWVDQETDAFHDWWDQTYGGPENFHDTVPERDDYWIRKGIALMAWIARGDFDG